MLKWLTNARPPWNRSCCSHRVSPTGSNASNGHDAWAEAGFACVDEGEYKEAPECMRTDMAGPPVCIVCTLRLSMVPPRQARRMSSHRNSRVSHFPAATRENSPSDQGDDGEPARRTRRTRHTRRASLPGLIHGQQVTLPHR
jgi:hypothetical protein